MKKTVSVNSKITAKKNII